MNYWLVVGTQENWKESLKKGNIWGLKSRQKNKWNIVQEGDIILFYAMRPVAGIIGYGTVKTKFRQTQPFWAEEVDKNKVIWPLCFEFNVGDCLEPDKWEAEKLSSELLRFKAGLSFRQIDTSMAIEFITKFKERHATVLEEPNAHKELKQMLVEIGKLQNFIAEEEYQFDLGRLDVVWRRVAQSVPTYVFEVCVKGDLYHDLSKLKHAYDIWNSRIFIVASDTEKTKVEHLLSGSFHEITARLRFIELGKVRELYKIKKNLTELEKELGI